MNNCARSEIEVIFQMPMRLELQLAVAAPNQANASVFLLQLASNSLSVFLSIFNLGHNTAILQSAC